MLKKNINLMLLIFFVNCLSNVNAKENDNIEKEVEIVNAMTGVLKAELEFLKATKRVEFLKKENPELFMKVEKELKEKVEKSK